jgi:hypothetical protein
VKHLMRVVSPLWFFLALTLPALPQQSPHFSGVYTLKSFTRSDSAGGGKFREQTSAPKTTLNISQGTDALDATFRFSSGKTVTLKYKLDDSESKNVDPDGSPTTDRAKLKGRELMVRSTMKIAAGDLKGSEVHRTENWELSKDLKTLTIRQQSDIPGAHMLGNTMTSTYTRQ